MSFYMGTILKNMYIIKNKPISYWKQQQIFLNPTLNLLLNPCCMKAPLIPYQRSLRHHWWGMRQRCQRHCWKIWPLWHCLRQRRYGTHTHAGLKGSFAISIHWSDSLRKRVLHLSAKATFGFPIQELSTPALFFLFTVQMNNPKTGIGSEHKRH